MHLHRALLRLAWAWLRVVANSLPCPIPQERLMLSILPKHVADEMLKDMKKDPSQKEMQQFNTMYMYRHENVR